MTTMQQITIAIFTVIAGVNIYTQTEEGKGGILLRKISKSMLMPVLMLIVWFLTFGDSGGGTIGTGTGGLLPSQVSWLFFALFFCWMGDVWLIGKKDWMFLCGLGSFLVGHIGYLIVFSQGVDLAGLPSAFWGLACVIFWYAVMLYKGVYPKEWIRLGMLVYMVAISAMIFSAMAWFYQTLDFNGFLLLLGALLFGSSDSVLAFRRIKGVELLPESYVMFSYISGQFLIVLGVLMH